MLGAIGAGYCGSGSDNGVPEVATATSTGRLTIIPDTPLFFRMCGSERTCRRAILYVWQGKGLQAHFSYVWQRKELRRNPWKGAAFERRDTPHPGGNSDGYQTKGVAEKGIRKTMKTKSRKTVDVDL